MKKLLLIIISIVVLVSFSACRTQYNSDEKNVETDEVISVAVGIVPLAAYVKAVAGDLAEVVTMIPSGYSPANFSPTTLQMQALSDAEIYFTLQMPAEQSNILPKAHDFNEDIAIVDLREAVKSEYPLLNTQGEELLSGENEAVDPHLWLSPKRTAAMVQKIAEELSKLDRGNEETYQANAASYIAKLNELDSYIRQSVSALKNKSFLIYHASYGYFEHDYGLEMIAIEIGGKQATAAELQNVIDYALSNNIKTVFYQEEFDENQAQTVAEEIGGIVQKTAPLSADYIQEQMNFTNALSQLGGQE